VEKETFTSTRLQIRLYTDSQCSKPYDDGQTARQHATKGYLIGSNYFPTKVSFKPPFYSCLNCAPEEISYTFSRENGNWYDDDYISQQYKSKNKNQNNAVAASDDQYLTANDDITSGSSGYSASGYSSNGNNRLLTVDISNITASAQKVSCPTITMLPRFTRFLVFSR
jgi:hypothetical protein